jgi:hypothetical protein
VAVATAENDAVVNGGLALIGDGDVDVAGSGGESVKFLSNSSGGLDIVDMQGKQAQFIDLVSVGSTGGITSSYSSADAANTSGTLVVSSGSQLVAAIEFVGTYSASDFHIISGTSGTVAITDPTVFNGSAVDTFPSFR